MMAGRPYLRSIRQKLFAGVLLTTLLALLISGSAMVIYELRDYHQRLVEDLDTQGKLLGLASAPALQFNDKKLARDSLALIQARPQILAAAIYKTNNRLFASYSASGETSEEFPPSPAPEGIRTNGDIIVLVQKVVDHDEILGTLYLKARYQLYERVWQYAGIVGMTLGVALVISTLLSLWMQARVTGPILGITGLARKVIEERDYNLRAVKSTDDEIGSLVDSFNELLSEVGKRELEVLRLNEDLEQRVIDRTGELERANAELEAFSYSVSHDLRTPLRAIDGFSQALLEDYASQLDDTARDYLARVRAGAQRMGQLIDDLLKLARVSRTVLNKEPIDLSAIATDIVKELRAAQPDRNVEVKITPAMMDAGDTHLIRIALENLLNNAWKYTGKRAEAMIEFGQRTRGDQLRYYIADNGAGFDMAYAGKLFGAFQRMHDAKEFAGTGVGLATVQRIIHRHGGRIWAEAEVDKGSTFYFTLAPSRGQKDEH
jgi:signal transduction histidine kinase